MPMPKGCQNGAVKASRFLEKRLPILYVPAKQGEWEEFRVIYDAKTLPQLSELALLPMVAILTIGCELSCQRSPAETTFSPRMAAICNGENSRRKSAGRLDTLPAGNQLASSGAPSPPSRSASSSAASANSRAIACSISFFSWSISNRQGRAVSSSSN